MFAKRVVTRAVTRNCLFCDSCMGMVADDEDFVVTRFALMRGERYADREVRKRDQYVICRTCYEHIAGAYEAHQQVIRDGSEGVFHREGITETEMRALFELNKGGRNRGVAEPPPEEGVAVKEDGPDKRRGWFWKLPARAAAL